MEEFNLKEILQTSEGIRELQSTIDGSGISINCPRSTFYYLDFGVLSTSDLEYEIEAPLGYEDCRTEKDRKVISKEFTLKCSTYHTLHKISVLPTNSNKLPLISVIYEGQDMNNLQQPIVLKPDEIITLTVTCHVNRDFIGFLGRWLIFMFERKHQPSLTCQKIEKFLFGIRILGCISKKLSARSQLSSEARVFIPQSSIIYFEDPCAHFSYFYLNHRYPNIPLSPKLQPPPNFLSILNEIRNICRPPNEFSINYIKAIRHRSLDLFATHCNVISPKTLLPSPLSVDGVSKSTTLEIQATSLSSTVDKILWDTLKTPESIIRYVQSMGKILWMEETQMAMDIAQYDIQFLNLSPMNILNKSNLNISMNKYSISSPSLVGPSNTTSNTSSSSSSSSSILDIQEKIVTCKIIVKGSNESRPRISIGDKIRFRPIKDSIHYLNNICTKPVLMYELEGIVLSYTLASETVICEIIAPPVEYFWANSYEPIEYTDIWAKVSYHARFTFERSGLVYCHLALADVLNIPTLRKTLFPTENSIHYEKKVIDLNSVTRTRNNTISTTLSTDKSVTMSIHPTNHNTSTTSNNIIGQHQYGHNNIRGSLNSGYSNFSSGSGDDQYHMTPTLNTPLNTSLTAGNVSLGSTSLHDNTQSLFSTSLDSIHYLSSNPTQVHTNTPTNTMKNNSLHTSTNTNVASYYDNMFTQQSDALSLLRPTSSPIGYMNGGNPSISISIHSPTTIQPLPSMTSSATTAGGGVGASVNPLHFSTNSNLSTSTINTQRQSIHESSMFTQSFMSHLLDDDIDLTPRNLNAADSADTISTDPRISLRLGQLPNKEQYVYTIASLDTHNESITSSPTDREDHTYFNKEQWNAIKSIVNLPPPQYTTPLPPFIVYGPPGTGKTSTIIEAIVQAHKKFPYKKILVCAPSDSAADVLCQRLKVYYTSSEMFRLNWWQRIPASVPVDILSYTSQNDLGVFEIPSYEDISAYRIIVSTCGTAGSISKLKPTITTANNNSSNIKLRTDDYSYTGTTMNTNYNIHNSTNSNLSTASGGNTNTAAVTAVNKPLSFDLVIIDEAAQATEAESYIPLSMCKMDGTGLMVLAGDPQQLGPMTRSSIFQLWGGPSSLQERLLSLPLYQLQSLTNTTTTMDGTGNTINGSGYNTLNVQRNNDTIPLSGIQSTSTSSGSLQPGTGLLASPNSSTIDKYKREISDHSIPSNYQKSTENTINLVVFLTKNYRSHSKILELSSRLFYNNQIEEYGAKDITHSLLPWNMLHPTISFPLLFIGVDGQHCHDLDSPSFHNPEEIDEVVSVCEKLLSSPDITVSTADIGIICAFRSQVLKMRIALRARAMGGINIGSVEDFQGQEMKVIIISTVLTSRVPALETKGSLGMLGDKKRFNVAISRGMALCIVVGQPYLLYTDMYWKEYIEYCYRHHSYRGYNCNLLKRITKLPVVDGSHPYNTKDIISTTTTTTTQTNRRHDNSQKQEDESNEIREGEEGGGVEEDGDGDDDDHSIYNQLNSVARMSILGSGVYDDMINNKTNTNYYFNNETQWRIIL